MYSLENIIKTPAEFPPTSNRFIAYFDIMGFKDYVYRNDHSKVGEMMDKVANIVQGIKLPETKILSGDEAKTRFERTVVLPVVFSDSIIFITKGDSEDDANKILHVASYFLYAMLYDGIPIKGALAYGTFTADFGKSLFFGRPLIDSYLLVDEIHYYGAIFHDTFEKYLKNKGIWPPQEYAKQGPVPLKCGDINHLFMDWRYWVENIQEENNIISGFYNGVSGNTRKYVDNTIRLFSQHPKKYGKK